MKGLSNWECEGESDRLLFHPAFRKPDKATDPSRILATSVRGAKLPISYFQQLNPVSANRIFHDCNYIHTLFAKVSTVEQSGQGCQFEHYWRETSAVQSLAESECQFRREKAHFAVEEKDDFAPATCRKLEPCEWVWRHPNGLIMGCVGSGGQRTMTRTNQNDMARS
jgi:hypothetical protein